MKEIFEGILYLLLGALCLIGILSILILIGSSIYSSIYNSPHSEPYVEIRIIH